MCSDYTRSALMYVDYGVDTYAGMGIKAMKSFGRLRGRKFQGQRLKTTCVKYFNNTSR